MLTGEGVEVGGVVEPGGCWAGSSGEAPLVGMSGAVLCFDSKLSHVCFESHEWKSEARL